MRDRRRRARWMPALVLAASAAMLAGPRPSRSAVGDGPQFPMPEPLTVVALPDRVTGGSALDAAITPSGVADHDRIVSLSTDHPECFAGFPPSATVPAWTRSVTVSLQTVGVASDTLVTVSTLCEGEAGRGSTAIEP